MSGLSADVLSCSVYVFSESFRTTCFQLTLVYLCSGLLSKYRIVHVMRRIDLASGYENRQEITAVVVIVHVAIRA